jgi:hypothetical protein
VRPKDEAPALDMRSGERRVCFGIGLALHASEAEVSR